MQYVRADLKMARTRLYGDRLLELHCFHAQQAAEKALKAVIVRLTGRPAPYTRDLLALSREVTLAGASPPLTAAEADLLTQFAVVTRYPGDLGEVDENEWRESVAVAERVVAWAEGIVEGGGEQ